LIAGLLELAIQEIHILALPSLLGLLLDLLAQDILMSRCGWWCDRLPLGLHGIPLDVQELSLLTDTIIGRLLLSLRILRVTATALAAMHFSYL